MEFFFLLILLIIVVVYLGRKPSQKDASHQEVYDAYWNGYKDLGRIVQEQLDAGTFDRQVIQAAIDKGQKRGQTSVEAGATLEEELDEALQDAAQTAPSVSAKKADKSVRNLNALLYMASFLLVAAGAAMLNASLPSSAKLIAVWLLVFAFYGTGLWLYGYSKKLRPAALAFAGTGLALLPFAGVALHEYGGISPTIAWFMTSIVGLAAYIFAALKLQNLVVSYLTLAFVLSLASSSVGTASLPIVWHFEAIIAVSLIASLVSFIKPSWLPKVFSEPVERTGQIVTPMVLVASLFVYDQLSLLGYEIVYLTAGAHYIVAWLQTKRYEYEHAARAVLHLTAIIFCWDFSKGDSTQFGLLFLALTLVQVVYSLIRRRRDQQDWWVWAVIALQVFGMSFWVASYDVYAHVLISLVAIAMTSFASGFILQKINLAVPGLIVTFIAPLVLARGVITPPLAWEWLAAAYVLAASASVAFYYYEARLHSANFRSLISSAVVGYAVLATAYSFLLGNLAGALVLLAIAVIAGFSSYVFKKPAAILGSTVAVTVALIRLWAEYGDHTWLYLAVAWIAGGIFYAASWMMVQRADNERQRYLLDSAWAVLIVGGLSGFFDPTVNVAAACTLVVVALTICVEGRRIKDNNIVEFGFYFGTFGLQRLMGIAFPDLNLVFYAHWWALSVVAIAFMRKQLMPRLVIAMGIITFVTVMYALSIGGNYALLFLVEHIALLVVGAIKGRSWAVWWGIIASSLAVVYFLRNIAFLAFGFLGLVVIAIAIWRLMKNAKDESHHSTKNHKL